MLAKWLQTNPSLLLLHEPTQGVDVGARQQIFQLIREAAADGTAVVCISTDYEQLAAVCDRVVVFGGGRVAHELTGGELTEDGIAEQCYRFAESRSGSHLDASGAR
jgi:ribose transport system ATP-binding protein